MNNPIWMHQLFAIFKREMRTKMSYRMTMVTSSLSIVAGLVAFGFLGNTSVVSVTTSAYGMSLSSFLVSGVAFAPIITNGLGLFSGYLYPSQIEAVMTTPTGFPDLHQYCKRHSLIYRWRSPVRAKLFVQRSRSHTRDPARTRDFCRSRFSRLSAPTSLQADLSTLVASLRFHGNRWQHARSHSGASRDHSRHVSPHSPILLLHWY